MKIFSIVLATLVLTGCEVQYRYACQDPNNWDKDICKKPLCDLTKECPEDIYKGVTNIKPSAPPPAPVPKGAC